MPTGFKKWSINHPKIRKFVPEKTKNSRRPGNTVKICGFGTTQNSERFGGN